MVAVLYLTIQSSFCTFLWRKASDSEEEIKQLSIEICKINRGESIESKEDKILQEKFWHIYFNKIDKKKTGNSTPQISPSFLRNNLDLLN